MADDNILRSYRSNDAARRVAASTRDVGANDPLAELARLIGQSDPFADMERGRGHSAANGAAGGYAAASPYGNDAPRTDSAPGDWRQTAAAMAREALRETSASEQHFAQVDSAVAAAKSLRTSPEDQFGHSADYPAQTYDQTAFAQDEYASAAHPEDAYVDDAAYGDGPERHHASHYDERPRAEMEQPAVQQDTENYFFDGAAVPAQPGFYDDPPRPRAANGLVTALVLVGCGILGTAGAYGYRTYYSGPRPTEAPIISADKSPSKIMAAVTSGDGQSGKSSERVGGGNERVVGRQEEPVALPDANGPRVVWPAPNQAPAGSAPAAQASVPTPSTAAPPVASSPPPATSAGEPKKVRTVPILPPGGSDGITRPIDSAANAPSSPAANGHQAQASRTAQSTSRNSGGPLSLDPQGQPTGTASSYQAVVSDRPRTPASAPISAPQLASAATTPASAGGAGGYMVQISSQRSEADAQASIRSLQSKYASQIGDREAVVRRADLGDKGVYYRALVGPFGTAGEADQFCGGLRAAGGQCYRLKN
jgi:SPOR domain